MKYLSFNLWFLSISFFANLLWYDSFTCAYVDSQVIELNDKFLQVKHEGLWIVKFYAPWCAHCKSLAPTWEQVGHALADRNSSVRVAKLDCTRYTNVATAMNIRAYPTIIFFRNGIELVYEGERKKDAIVDYVIKSSGPVITSINSPAEFSEISRLITEPFFFYVGDGTEYDELRNEYEFIAGKLFTSIRFHFVSAKFLPDYVTIDWTSLPTALVFKDMSYAVYHTQKDGNLTKWIYSERWPLMPLVTPTNIKEAGRQRMLVLSVVNMVERNNLSTTVGKFQSVMASAARLVRENPNLSPFYQFGWIDGSELANNIVMETVRQPNFIVFNVSSYEYYRHDDIPNEATVQSVLSFLERILSGDIKPLGGRTLPQRIKRTVYEFVTNIYDMFSAQPLLTTSLFGVPLAFLSLITYCLFSTEFSVDRDEIYPDEEYDESTDISDDEDHEKAE